MAHPFLIDPLLLNAHPALREALELLEPCLNAWAGDRQRYAAVLAQAFGCAADAKAAEELRAEILAAGLRLPLLTASLPELRGAYAAPQLGAPERVFLDPLWLANATGESVVAVLLEELGHAIDQRLNGSTDSPGDEGEIFSALLRGLPPAETASREQDQRSIAVAGQALLVEAASDTTPARVISGNPYSPAFTASASAFGLPDVGTNASPSFVDIDGDGDLDGFIGGFYGNTLNDNIQFFRNTGTAQAPAFSASASAFGLGGYLYNISPSFADIDGDGDLDAFLGEYFGNTLFFRNTGSASAPAFAAVSTIGLANVTNWASPSFVDIDGDGDFDAFLGNRDGHIFFFRNTGTATAPGFAASAHGFGLPDVGEAASPSFVDIDGDGDLDAFIGQRSGNTLFFANMGNASVAAFAPSASSFGLPNVGTNARPSFADIDNDGDLDAFIGDRQGNTLFFRNTSAGGLRSSNPSGTYGIGSTITIQVPFSEPVFVNTTGGMPTLLLESGATDRQASYSSGSGSRLLNFTYTIQLGDNSPDLDIQSSNALQLNGASIRDVAGNDADLRLPAPGELGSLGANADLVIDGIYTTGPNTINGVNLGSTFLGYALRPAGGTPLQVIYPGGNASGSNPGNGWSAFAAAPSGSGYRLYWRNSASQQVALWDLNANGIYQSGNFLTASQLFSEEANLNLDLNGDGYLSGPSTINGVNLGSTFLGYALLRAGGTPLQVVYPGGNASASNPGHGWSAVAAAASGSGYRFYWRNNANQQVALWNLNASGVYQSGGFLSASELFSEEASLNLDLNGDGYTSGPSTINGVNLGSTFLGYALLAAGGTPLQVVYSGGNASASNPGNGLSAVAAAPSGSGYRLYWRTSANQQVTLWNLNASGIYQAGGVLSASQLVSEEANLNFDLNADGFISGPVSINGVNLGSTYSGYALQRAGGTPLQVVYPGGNASASNPGNGWSAVAAAPSGSGYRLYWRHNDSQQMAVWTLNASGVYTSGSLLSASQLFNEEANLNLDLNIDGYISGPSTINGVNLGATFLGYALLQAGGTPLQVTYPGGNASISNPGNGWSAVAAAANGAGYRFYWRNTTTQQVALWNLDASGSYQSGGFLSDAQVYSNETSLNADLNNDTVIGSPFTNVENQGNASLLRRSDGMAVVQVGSNRYPVTSPFNLGVGDRTSTWQMLAAENIAGQPQILWRNNAANFLHLWSLDSSWSWQSSYGEISPFSPLAVGLENNFQIDLNGNGVIG